MEQPSPTNDSKHLQEDTERAISRAAAEQGERGPEALLNAVCTMQTQHRHPSAGNDSLYPHDHCPTVYEQLSALYEHEHHTVVLTKQVKIEKAKKVFLQQHS